MMKSVVFVPEWKDGIVKERLHKDGTLSTHRIERHGVFVGDWKRLGAYLAENEGIEGVNTEVVEVVYVAHHPRDEQEKRRMRPDQLLGDIADDFAAELSGTLDDLWAGAGVETARGRRFQSVLERLEGERERRRAGGPDKPIKVIAKCMRQDEPDKKHGTGSHIFKALGALAIAEFEKAENDVIQKHVHDLKELFRLDRDELFVRWHRVMTILSAVDLDLLALEKLMQGGSRATGSKSAEYLKLMLAAAPEGGFTGMAHFVRSETEDLSKKWGGSVSAERLAVIVDFLERVGLLEAGGEVEPGLAEKLVEDAKGEGRYHSCVWALSQHFADLAS